jgi:hypothetical protein
MSDEAKRVHIHWRRMLFGFHLLMWLVARLAVGSINQMPPEAIYNLLEIWGFLVFGHGLALAMLDARDDAELPFEWMRRLVNPRERRYSLLALDAAVWVIVTMAIASRVIPEDVIFQNAVPLSLAWLALTAFGICHVLLVVYAEVRERWSHKPKHMPDSGIAEHLEKLAFADDGELIDFEDAQRRKNDHR